MNEISSEQTRPIRVYVLNRINHCQHGAFWQHEYKPDDRYKIVIVTAGSGKVELEAEGFISHLEKGKSVLLPPEGAARIMSWQSGLSFYELAFTVWGEEGAVQDHFATAFAGTYQCPLELNCQPFSQCIDYVEAIMRLHSSPDEMAAFDGHVFFQELLRFLFQQNRPAGEGASTRKAVEQSIKQLRDRYREVWTVDELAAMANITRGHYTRMFKDITGLIPLDYLNGVRMDRAKQLLEKTDDRLFEIAQHVGFSNEYYFSRRFKQTVGISPGQYRRSHRDGIRVFAPFLEDFLVALGITPVSQCSHTVWGKQDYLGLQHVPAFDIEAADIEALSKLRPDFIIMDGGMERWLASDSWRSLAPTYSMPHRGEDWRSTLRTVADLLGKETQVPGIIERYESKANEARRVLGRSVRRETVACLRVSALGISLYAGAEQGYTGPVLYKDLGLTPHPLIRQLTGGARKACVTLDWLAQLDADHLFITFDKRHSAYEEEERRLLASSEWQALPAARNGRVYEVDFLTWMNYGVLSHGKKIDDVLQVLA